LPLPGVAAAYPIPARNRALAGELDRSARPTKADGMRPSIIDDEEEDTTVEPLEAASRIAAAWADRAAATVPVPAATTGGARSLRPSSVRPVLLSAAFLATFIAGFVAGGLFLRDSPGWLTHRSPPGGAGPVAPAAASAAPVQAAPPPPATPTGPVPIAAPPSAVRTAAEAPPQTTRGRPTRVLKIRGLTLTGSPE